MGLDIYAGTLTRYYSGNWKTQAQQFAEANGMGFSVTRPNDENEETEDEEITPEEVCQIVSQWRDQVVAVIEKNSQKPKSFFDRLKKNTASLSVWEENNEKDYYTDKPDWDGYGALLLVAAARIYNEEIPEPFPEEWSSHPLIERAMGDNNTVNWSLLHEISMWLPYETEIILDGMSPNDNQISISTAGNLLNELNKINEMCWKADEETILSWRETEGYGVGTKFASTEDVEFYNKAEQLYTESEAKLAFSIFYRAAKYSLENKVPILLDY